MNGLLVVLLIMLLIVMDIVDCVLSLTVCEDVAGSAVGDEGEYNDVTGSATGGEGGM